MDPEKFTSDYLEALLDPRDNQWRRRDHPEKRPSEVWYTNLTPPTSEFFSERSLRFEEIPFKYKRLGTMAYASNGRQLDPENHTVVFVQTSEIELELLRRQADALEERCDP